MPNSIGISRSDTYLKLEVQTGLAIFIIRTIWASAFRASSYILLNYDWEFRPQLFFMSSIMLVSSAFGISVSSLPTLRFSSSIVLQIYQDHCPAYQFHGIHFCKFLPNQNGLLKISLLLLICIPFIISGVCQTRYPSAPLHLLPPHCVVSTWYFSRKPCSLASAWKRYLLNM